KSATAPATPTSPKSGQRRKRWSRIAYCCPPTPPLMSKRQESATRLEQQDGAIDRLCRAHEAARVHTSVQRRDGRCPPASCAAEANAGDRLPRHGIATCRVHGRVRGTK